MNHLWQSTCFAAAVWLLTAAFRRHGANVRYWLWFSASAKFLLPFTLLMALGQLFPAPSLPPAQRAVVALKVEQIAQPFSDPVSLAPAPRPTRDWLRFAIFGVWTCGFLTVAAIRFRGWLRIRATIQASTPWDTSAPTKVRVSPGLLEPGVVGFWRPTLLLPAGIADRLTPRQLEAVLAHEFSHIARRDNLFAAVHMLVEAVFWFHPLVWWIGTRLVEERERACDEEVLRLGSEPHIYAEAILNVCKLYVESPLACVPGVTGADLKKRVEAILSGRLALKLNFGRKLALALAGLAALMGPIMVGILRTAPLQAQSAPAFEVASVKPCKVDPTPGGAPGGRKGGGGGRGSSPGRLATGCDTLANLIRGAYISYPTGVLVRDPASPRLQGGPDWIETERYEIDAKAEGEQSQGTMLGPMMQRLLEERFKLKIHRANREVPVYLLTVAKDGPKLTPFREGSCTVVEFGVMRFPRPQDMCQALVRGSGPSPGIDASGVTVGTLAKLLFLIMDRPVIDRTGIQGLYDFKVSFSPDENTPFLDPKGDGSAPPLAAPVDVSGPSIFAALQKQLGLRLEPGRGPREFLVIDRVGRPSEN